jgi:hypothetical protein
VKERVGVPTPSTAPPTPLRLPASFLSTFRPVFFLRPRDYSKSVPIAPFIVNYSGALFREFPGPWQARIELNWREMNRTGARARPTGAVISFGGAPRVGVVLSREPPVPWQARTGAAARLTGEVASGEAWGGAAQRMARN